MKRAMTGGAHRGPVAAGRQRRTIRVVQSLLVAIAVGLLLFAGYSWGKRAGFEAARSADALDRPQPPAVAQVIVLSALGLTFIGAALVLQGNGLGIPTPARLDELAGRAESAAVERAEEAARLGG